MAPHSVILDFTNYSVAWALKLRSFQHTEAGFHRIPFRGGGEAINSVKTELLFCLLENKLTKTEHKRRVIAKLAICKKKKKASS